MRYTTLPLILLLLGVAAHTGAQTAPAKLPAKAPVPLTLSQALAKLPPPVKGVLLAVGADKLTLPDGTSPPPADASPTILANTFGDITEDFGTVTAIAPATRVLLNPTPAPPDMSVDIGTYTGFKMLAASLDDTQWKMLTSEGGLGLPDLTDDTQKLLFHNLFPHGELWVASKDPAQERLPGDQRTDTRNVSDQIDGVRVRLGQTLYFYIHDKKGNAIIFSKPSADTTRLHTWQPERGSPVAQHNVLLRAVVPNTLKLSDLDLSDAKFQQTVTLTGIKTVGELVARIAEKAQAELYADPHYATRTVTVIGPIHKAPAADVLRALALAVAGTYRQVGPAFVLTDDLEGVGTRRKRLANWEEGASNSRLSLGYQAGAIMLKRRAAQARLLPSFGDPLALTPDQEKAMTDVDGLPGIPAGNGNAPYASLTPAQQSEVRRIADSISSNDFDPPQEPDPTGAVTLRPHTTIQFLIPTVEGPVDGRTILLSLLYWPGNAVAESMAREAAAKAGPAVPPPPVPPLMPLLLSRPHRAIRGHPATAAAVDALIAAMQKIGLNELWLDVFSEGKSHLDTKGTDILTEALTKTQGTEITIYANMSLLPWGNQPPEDTRDLDILGENSQEASSAYHARSFEEDSDATGKSVAYVPPPVFVSPVSATVKKTLTDMVRSLAARPGLAGFVWEDAGSGGILGYTPAMRLAFLRAFHADPADIPEQQYAGVNVSLPTFDDDAVDDALTKQWSDARLGASAFLLTQMRLVIPASANKPILMERSDHSPGWLASWDDPRQLPPSLRTLFAGMDDPTDAEVQAVAAKQGKSTLVVISVSATTDTEALARSLQKALPPPASPKSKLAWDGYVLDFDDPHVTDSTEPLRDLIQAVTPK